MGKYTRYLGNISPGGEGNQPSLGIKTGPAPAFQPTFDLLNERLKLMEKMRKDLKRLSWIIALVAVGLIAALTILINITF
jgi:hypothetical protein